MIGGAPLAQGHGPDDAWAEPPTSLSRSSLWDLQAAYFAERGIDAWRQGEVPHYVTSNPTIAAAYAEIVFAFRRDLLRLGRLAPGDPPMTICELGAGTGRFAFHFLNRLKRLCASEQIAPTAFRYVLTDANEATLAFLQAHRRFQGDFESELLDVAYLDLLDPASLQLRIGGEIIGPGTLGSPLVVIANYVFDSLPQDLFHFREGVMRRCLVSLEGHPSAVTPSLNGVEMRYILEDAVAADYPEPAFQQVLEHYSQTLEDSHLLFPAPALRGLAKLSDLSRDGMMVLSADKGEHRLDRMDHQPPPVLALHGSVSLPVNYDAFARVCAQEGGAPLVTGRGSRAIDVIGLLRVRDAAAFRETGQAYERHVAEFGPDDFQGLMRRIRDGASDMSFEDVMVAIRLSRDDSHQFTHMLPRLLELAPDMTPAEHEDMTATLDRVWSNHFSLGDDLDLAGEMAALLYRVGDYAGALEFYRRSVADHGAGGGTLFNMASCFYMLEQDREAADLLQELVRREPSNLEARALLIECGGQAAPKEASSPS